MVVKLCDKCFKIGDYKPGPCVVVVGVEQYDLCASCEAEVRELINAEEKPRKGRPKAAKQ